MSLLGDTLRTQRTAKPPHRQFPKPRAPPAMGAAYLELVSDAPTAASHRAWTSDIASASFRDFPKQ